MNDIQKIYNKLLIMAEKGTENERKNAKILLKKFKKKYSFISEEQIQEERIIKIPRFKNVFFKKLFFQCVVNSVENAYYTDCSNKIKILGSELDERNIFLKYNYYKILLEEELNYTYIAFIHNFDIFSIKHKENSSSQNKSNINIERLMKHINIISGKPYNNKLQLELKSHEKP